MIEYLRTRAVIGKGIVVEVINKIADERISVLACLKHVDNLNASKSGTLVVQDAVGYSLILGSIGEDDIDQVFTLINTRSPKYKIEISGNSTERMLDIAKKFYEYANQAYRNVPADLNFVMTSLDGRRRVSGLDSILRFRTQVPDYLDNHRVYIQYATG